MYPDKDRVLLGDWQDVTGDREQDGLICAMRAVEARLGERRGWDRAPTLFTMHLADIDTGAVEVRPVPPREWRVGLANPADDLTAISRRLPPPDRSMPTLAYADAPDGIAAVAFMFEAWAADEESLTDEQRTRQAAGERVLAEAPASQRVEARILVAVDINGHGFHIARRRGHPLEKNVILTSPDEMWAPAGDGPGRVIRALHRLAVAARTANWGAGSTGRHGYVRKPDR